MIDNCGDITVVLANGLRKSGNINGAEHGIIIAHMCPNGCNAQTAAWRDCVEGR